MRKEELEVCNEEHVIPTSEQGRSILPSNNGDFQGSQTADGESRSLFSTYNVDHLQGDKDVPILSEHEKQELVSLVKDKHISMDFILEMKEAFLMFIMA